MPYTSYTFLYLIFWDYPCSKNLDFEDRIMAMAARSIIFIWKIARPKNEAIARGLAYAAYITAIQTDPNATVVLIR